MNVTNVLVWLIVLGMFGWMGYNYFRIRRAAKIVDNAEFEELIRKGQLVDLRDPNEFHAKHILGARNIPSNQLKVSLSALRKDKPVLLYENSRGSRVTNAALFLKNRAIKISISCPMVWIHGMGKSRRTKIKTPEAYTSGVF